MFGPETSTETVYQGVGKRIVESFLKGINGTIFAYGQTSSGKTYTMHGDENTPGLLYLASKDIFSYMANTPEREFILRGSYVELYKEEVKDLLDPSTPTLRIRESYERGVYVESKEEVIHNYEDLMNVGSLFNNAFIHFLVTPHWKQTQTYRSDQHEPTIFPFPHHLQTHLRKSIA